jgi:hypothetical protein
VPKSAKGRAGGRPRNDDSVTVAEILWRSRVEGHDFNTVLRAAVTALVQDQATAAAADGKRKRVIQRVNATRRLSEAVAKELLTNGDDALTGLAPKLRRFGEHFALVARREGYIAGRSQLIRAIAYNLTWGKIDDPALLRECLEVADALVSEIESSLENNPIRSV